MAQKIQTLLIDDLDGGEAEETVRFGLDARVGALRCGDCDPEWLHDLPGRLLPGSSFPRTLCCGPGCREFRPGLLNHDRPNRYWEADAQHLALQFQGDVGSHR